MLNICLPSLNRAQKTDKTKIKARNNQSQHSMTSNHTFSISKGCNVGDLSTNLFFCEIYFIHCCSYVRPFTQCGDNTCPILTVYNIRKSFLKYDWSSVVRKPAFCICENKDADQLCGNREADQRLCFRYIDSTITLLSIYEISSLWPSCVALQPGLCQTWWETPKTGFHTTRLIYAWKTAICMQIDD